MNDSPAIPAPTTLFDPAAPVPEEFDVFCEGCGYSLVALSGDRCPECGRPFDPGALPYARVPWLHRRRIGRWSAYWRTVGQVVKRPGDFAAELCRPVRISADDAHRFRKVSALVAATSVLAAVGVTFYLTDGMPRRWQGLLGFAILMLAGWVMAVVFFRLVTDMPVFIWKGLPSSPEHELAPLHHYAAAPLALAPLVGVVMVGLPGLAVFTNAPAHMISFAVGPGLVVAVGWLALCWRTPVALMRGATGATPRQVAALAAYLPVHALLMILVAFLGFAVCMAMLVPVAEYISRNF